MKSRGRSKRSKSYGARRKNKRKLRKLNGKRKYRNNRINQRSYRKNMNKKCCCVRLKQKKSVEPGSKRNQTASKNTLNNKRQPALIKNSTQQRIRSTNAFNSTKAIISSKELCLLIVNVYRNYLIIQSKSLQENNNFKGKQILDFRINLCGRIYLLRRLNRY